MESIEKLRELAADINSTEIIDHLDVVGKFMFHTEWLDSWHKAFNAACDGIEREIAERYMELPLDADGMPIHYGDSLAYCGEHGGIVTGKVSNMEYRERSYGEADWLVNVSGWIFPSDTHHVKPRTLEDVLADLVIECDERYGEGKLRGDLFPKYAAEIRELLGVEE